MSEHAATAEHKSHAAGEHHHHESHGEHHHAPPPPKFDEYEIEEFEADDNQAGSAIGKMLALFFLYTVIVMALAAWWTFRAVNN